MSVVNVAIVGAGGRAAGFCNYISKHPEIVRLTALVDIDTVYAALLNNHFKLGAHITSDINEGIDLADAVLISTPDYAHVDPAVTALKTGKHVYLEKPLATSIADCDTIIKAAQHSLSICYLGFNLRHSPVHEKVHDLVQQDRLGKITTIEANEWYYGGRTYFRRWNRLRKYGGGLWLTKACHDLDVITWIAGGRPVSIYASSSLSNYTSKKGAGPRCRDCVFKDSCPDFYDITKPMQNMFEEARRQLQLRMPQEGEFSPDICLYNSNKDTFDNGMAIINFDNDVRASYTVSVLVGRPTRQMRVVGTEAMVEMDMELGIVTLIKRHSKEKVVYDTNADADISDSHGGADEKIFTDFFNICVNGGTPRSNLFDGLKAVELSLAATKSDDTDSLVHLSNKEIRGRTE